MFPKLLALAALTAAPLLPTAAYAATIPPPLPALNPVRDISVAEFTKNFANPGRDFSTGPLWVWNDRLTEEQIRTTLRDLAAQNVKQAWVHPRPGLMTPYLSPEWFALWKAALDEAQKLDMNIWIYDENSYPSGFAGVFVPEAMPESRGMSLVFSQVASAAHLGSDVWYVFDGDNKNITAAAKKAGKLAPLPNGKNYLLARSRYAGPSGWYAGKWHVDLLKKSVTEKFLDITLDAYNKVPEIQREFGKRVPGIFTDEPHPMGIRFGGLASSFHWNDEFAAEFEKRFGYSLVDNIPSLVHTIGDWKRIRHNYHQFVLDIFIDNFVKPYSERAEKYKLQLTGHYWEHGWPGTSNGPDNMAMYAWMQRPAIDLLMNTYNDNSPGAQFGNVRIVKELASVANQMGRSRTLSENYGAGGWDLRIEDMKRLGDWSYALGVNTNNEHLSYVTIRGARKRDHPQSLSYHSSLFEGYHKNANHFTRLSYALSQGRQINKILVIEPTSTAWLYQGQKKLGTIGRTFTDFVNSFEHAQVEYDLGSERIFREYGRIDGKQFIVNHASYDLVVIPPNCENLNKPTVELLQQYVKNGGRLLVAGEVPSHIDGASGDAALNAEVVTPEEAVKIAVKRTKATDLYIEVAAKTRNIFHHRRKLADGEVLFICNASQKETENVTVYLPSGKHISYILENGEILESYHNEVSTGSRGVTGFKIPPSGDVLLLISDRKIDGIKSQNRKNPQNLAGSPMSVRRPAENVLVLDFVDITVGGVTHKDTYTWQANRLAFQKVGFGGNPWDNQVQFRDTLIKKTFPVGSGFEAEYHFTLRDNVPQNLSIVIERSDLYKVTCNGVEIKALPGAWWLDRAFGKIDISKVAKVGKNTVKIKASPMLIEHEIESAYLLGDFSLEPAEKGFIVTQAKPLKIKGEQTNVLIHNEELDGVAWLSAGVGVEGIKKDDRAPAVSFTPGDQIVSGVRIWNYNERNLKQRGAKTVELANHNNKTGTTTKLAVVDLPIGNGVPFTFLFDKPQKLKTLLFTITSNHAGVQYPLAKNAKPVDNGFVGLAEVQVLDKDGNPIAGTNVVATSELYTTQHNRRVRYLTDGSGLSGARTNTAWNQQGLPFYSGKVAYSRTFTLDKVENPAVYSVFLPNSPSGWYGGTARVRANGHDAGFVYSAPWGVEVTKWLKSGANEIVVEVYGTPKNLVGPHHNGHTRGTAWPRMFQNGPKSLPPGTSYDTIGYGLFEEFTLQLSRLAPAGK